MSESRASLYYLGAKTRLVHTFRRIFEETWPDTNKSVFVDAMAGTGIVTKYIGPLFARSIVNDQELYSKLVLVAQFARPADLEPWPVLPASAPGFITANYCPRKKARFSQNDRMFWSRDNGLALDAFRNWAVATLKGAQLDYAMGCMIIAADRCSNTTGGYWGYLRHFNGAQGRRRVSIQQLPECELDVEVRSEDATALCLSAPKESVIYLDPPYGRRPYGPNYSILDVIGSAVDTIVESDRNKPGGVTGMAVERDFKKSVWNSPDALAELQIILRGTPASRLVLSYSNDPANTMKVTAIQLSFADCGWTVKTHELDHTRYASQNPSPHGPKLTEMLFVAERIPQGV